MSVLSDAAVSRGDLGRRLAELERQVTALTTARRLEAASIGRGGLRIKGGRLLAEDTAADRVFEVTTNPASIFMRQELIEGLGRSIFREQIRWERADGQVSTSSDDPVQLTGGPEVPDVAISDLGLAIVFVSGLIFGNADLTEPGVAGSMNVTVSGATDVEPDERNRLAMTGMVLPSDENDVTFQFGATRVIVFDQLNEGSHTFTTVYSAATGFPTVNFSNRSLVVIAF